MGLKFCLNATKEDGIFNYRSPAYIILGFPGSSAVKNLPAVQETQEMRVQSLGQEDPLEESLATNSSVLAWEIPWTEEPGGLSPQGHKESDTTEATLHTHAHLHCFKPLEAI